MTASRTVTVLVSPSAGRGRARSAGEAVLAELSRAGLTPELLSATSAAEAERQARDAVAAGTAAVVTVGGDGTAHTGLQAVAGTTTPLAVVPAGTGNDIALAVGVPADPLAAARAAAADLLEGSARPVDAGRTAGRWWLSVLCCGFDSAVSDRANRLRWPRGRRRYDVAILAELAALRPREVTLTLDGESAIVPVTLIAVGNMPCYGGAMRICPDAEPDDGRFDVTVVGPMTRRELIRSRPLLTEGTHVRLPGVTVHRATRVELACAGVTSYADGEPVAPLPVLAECVPGAVQLLGTGRR